MRLLIIEDEARIAEILRSALSRSGFAVDAVGLCGDARAALEVNPYDAVILDLGLPDGDGLALLKDMRARGNAVPVLVLTARDAVEHRVAVDLRRLTTGSGYGCQYQVCKRTWFRAFRAQGSRTWRKT